MPPGLQAAAPSSRSGGRGFPRPITSPQPSYIFGVPSVRVRRGASPTINNKTKRSWGTGATDASRHSRPGYRTAKSGNRGVELAETSLSSLSLYNFRCCPKTAPVNKKQRDGKKARGTRSESVWCKLQWPRMKPHDCLGGKCLSLFVCV